MKLFIFDMGGVLTGNVACIPDMAAHLGLSADAFYRGAGSDPGASHTSPYNLGDLAELMKGSISPETFWARFSGRTGLRVGEDLWGTFFRPEPIPGTYAAIEALKARGRRVVCGTNTLRAHYRSHADQGHYACFHAVYASHLMGVIKPDPAFWRRILESEGCDPSDAFFVDDTLENVRAAEYLGIRSHRFTDPAALGEALREWIGPGGAR